MLIENGVELSKYGDAVGAGQRNQFVYVGRLARNKNIDGLMDAFSILSAQREGLTLHIVGEDVAGVMASRTDDECRALRGRGIQYHGQVSDDDLRPIVDQSRFFVSASQYEGFGLAVVEAMAVGKIPIVNDIPAMRAIIGHGKNGYLIDFAAPSAAAQAMARILDLPEASHQETSRQAALTAQKYGWGATARKFEEQYVKALHQHPRH